MLSVQKAYSGNQNLSSKCKEDKIIFIMKLKFILETKINIQQISQPLGHTTKTYVFIYHVPLATEKPANVPFRLNARLRL